MSNSSSALAMAAPASTSVRPRASAGTTGIPIAIASSDCVANSPPTVAAETMPDQLPRPEGLAATSLVDIGVNLTAPQFDGDLPAVLERARAAGIVRQLVTGTDLPHSRSAMAMAASHPGELYATAGVHPHAAGAVPAAWRRQLHELLTDPEVRAVGETG